MRKYVKLLAALMLLFLPAGAETAKAAPTANNALRVAILNNNLELMADAINKGADVNFVQDDYTDNPLSMALNNDSLPAVKLLLQKGANPNVYVEGNGVINSTPLLKAIGRQDAALVKLLVEAGADVNMPAHRYHQPAQKDLSPLMQAVIAIYTRDTMDIFNYLIERGADVNYATYDGYTALMLAAGVKHSFYKQEAVYSMAEILLQKGANLSARNSRGQTALDLALESNFSQLAMLLRHKAGI
ncbi:MAG: ankyrin repeat domain-containing protein [Acidaminococcales bacterium]|nr:ankyrin repeat domain-containing protein [Acidaminococcales bacterium]